MGSNLATNPCVEDMKKAKPNLGYSQLIIAAVIMCHYSKSNLLTVGHLPLIQATPTTSQNKNASVQTESQYKINVAWFAKYV